MDRPRTFLIADDNDRRTIERLLHDGPQQELIALAVTVQLARQLIETDPASAGALLDEVREGIQQTLAGLRTVAERLHPPLLDSQGLETALRMAAGAARMPTRVETAIDGHVPPEVAVTVYRCCAMTLAAAAGETPWATLSARSAGESLEFQVTLGAACADPHALDALTSRVELLGGSLEIASRRVAGQLPLAS